MEKLTIDRANYQSSQIRGSMREQVMVSEFQRLLHEEVMYLRKNWRREGLPSNYKDLPGVGFLIGNQIGFLNSEKLGENLTQQARRTKWARYNDDCLRGWIREYLQGAVVFPGVYEIEEVDGKEVVIDSRHGAGMKLSDTISKKERNGAVYSMIVDDVCPTWIHKKKPFIVSTSPAGESGILDGDGNMIPYTDTHFSLSEKRGKVIYEKVIKTDLLPDETREFLLRLHRTYGDPAFVLPENPTVEQLILAVAKIDQEKFPITKTEVVNLMQQVRFDLLPKHLPEKERERRAQYAYKDKTWKQVLNECEEDGWNQNPKKERYLKEFYDFAVSDKWETQDELQEYLAVTILQTSKDEFEEKRKTIEAKMQSFYKMANKVDLELYYSHVRGVPFVSQNYGGVLRNVSLINGCAGGGNNDTNRTSVPGETLKRFVSDSLAKVGLTESKKILCCTCPFCGKQVEAVIASGKISCPECNSEADWSETVSGE